MRTPLICLLLIAMGLPVLGESPRELVARGNKAFEKGEFETALSLYDEASEELPEAAEVYFNRGTALYKQEEYEEAAKAFKNASLKSEGERLTSRAKYNLGNCAFRQAQGHRDSDLEKTIEYCRASIAFYQEARDLDKEFAKAAENIEIVRLYLKILLDEQQKEQGEKGESGEEGEKEEQKEEEKEEQEQPEQEENPLDEIVKKLKDLIKRQEELRERDLELVAKRPKPEEREESTVEDREDPAGASEEEAGKSAEEDPDGGEEPVVEPNDPREEEPVVSEAMKQWNASVTRLHGDQSTLKDETVEVHGEMKELIALMRLTLEDLSSNNAQPPTQPAQAPDPQQQKAMLEAHLPKLEAASGHVGTATTHEGVAVSDLTAGDLDSAAQSQERARDSLEAALKELSDPNQDDQSQNQSKENQEDQNEENEEQKDQEGENDQEDKDQQKDQEQKDQNGENQENKKDSKDPEEQQSPEQPPSEPESEEERRERAKQEMVDDILKEEKRNLKRRPVGPIQIIPVDRDW